MSDSPPRAPAARSQTDVVVHGIRELVLRGALRPGDRLPIEKELAAELGVSRGSLREGVRALALMGVLETRQGDGTYVTALDASLLLAPMGFVIDMQADGQSAYIASVRRVLEAEAAAVAARRVDAEGIASLRAILDRIAPLLVDPSEEDHERMLEADIDLHSAIARAAGNPVLEALIQALSSRTLRTRLWRSVSEEGAIARTFQQHTAIVDALETGDPDRARTAMNTHLYDVQQFAASRAVEDPLSP